MGISKPHVPPPESLIQVLLMQTLMMEVNARDTEVSANHGVSFAGRSRVPTSHLMTRWTID